MKRISILIRPAAQKKISESKPLQNSILNSLGIPQELIALRDNPDYATRFKSKLIRPGSHFREVIRRALSKAHRMTVDIDSEYPYLRNVELLIRVAMFDRENRRIYNLSLLADPEKVSICSLQAMCD